MNLKKSIHTLLVLLVGCAALSYPYPSFAQDEQEDAFQMEELPEAVGPLVFDSSYWQEEESEEIALFTGWKEGSYYQDGELLTGLQTIYGTSFLLDFQGKPRTGLIDGRYYNPQTGALFQNGRLVLQGQLYQADEEGLLTSISSFASQEESLEAFWSPEEESETREASETLNQCVVVSASNSNGSIQGFESKAKAALQNNQLLVLKHDYLGQNTIPEQEAHTFYLAIKDYIGKALPILSFELNSKETGLRYLQRFLDAFTVLSHVKPFLYVPSNMVYELDFDKFDGLYPVTNSLTSFPLTESSFQTQIKPNAPTNLEYMYRLYNPNSGEHFYTASQNERDTLVTYGWMYEHLGWIASKTGSPVYRVYNPNAGDHHYTLDSNERSTLIRLGWIDEEIGWYSSNDKAQPVYRAYNPNAEAGSHHFTTNGSEIQALVAYGWSDEEIAWYGTTSNLKELTIPSVPYINESYCYNENGVKLQDIQKVNGKLYYFDPNQNGRLDTIHQGVTNIGKGRLICFQEDGVLYTGPYQSDQKLYWFLPDAGYAVTNEFLLVPAQYNNKGITDFLWFNESGYAQEGQPDCKTEAKRQQWRGNTTWFVDSTTGAAIPCREYFDQQYGTSTLNHFMGEALLYEGTPYVWAGKGPATGFDCSGLMTWCMNQRWLINVQPFFVNALSIYTNYCDPVETGQQKPGDMVFWRGTYGSDPNYVSHVGIYVGNGWTYCAGDPIGFYPIDATLRPDGSVAPSFYGRISTHHFNSNPPALERDGRPAKEEPTTPKPSDTTTNSSQDNSSTSSSTNSSASNKNSTTSSSSISSSTTQKNSKS